MTTMTIAMKTTIILMKWQSMSAEQTIHDIRHDRQLEHTPR